MTGGWPGHFVFRRLGIRGQEPRQRVMVWHRCRWWITTIYIPNSLANSLPIKFCSTVHNVEQAFGMFHNVILEFVHDSGLHICEIRIESVFDYDINFDTQRKQKDTKPVHAVRPREWLKLYMMDWVWLKGSHMTKGSLGFERNRQYSCWEFVAPNTPCSMALWGKTTHVTAWS